MAKIPNTQLSWTDMAGPDEFLLSNGDTLDFRGAGHVLILRNPTGAPISPVLTGSAATFVDLPGIGRVDLTGGYQVGAIAAGASVVVPVGAHYHFMSGTVTLTNCAGLRALSLEDAGRYWPAPIRWEMSRLFWDGSVGVVIDPAKTAALYQDVAGAVPVTAVGQPVGLALDQSGGARHATQSTSAARPTYRVDAGSRPYLEFDGVDDWLATAIMSMAAGGRTVIAAMQKRSDANIGTVVETGPDWSIAPGAISLIAPSMPATATYGSRTRPAASPSNLDSPASFAAPHTAVLSLRLAAGSHVVRVNGATVASGAPADAVSALTAAINIGARSSGSRFGAINLYGLIVIDRALNDFELARAEAWAALKCGVVL